MKAKKLLVLLLAFVMLFTAAGCGGGGGAEVDKESLIIAIDSDATALDPLKINDTTTMSILSNVYEPLVRMGADNEPVAALAKDWDISKDGKEYTFYLRDDATFHDGTPITAADVVYTMDQTVASPYTGPYVNFIEKTEAVDDYTVKITLQYAYAPFLALCSVYSEVIPNGCYENADLDMSKNPNGSGPYKFVEWAQGDKIVFEAYEGYYGGQAAIKNLTFKVISDSTTAALALESGEVHMNLNVGTADVESFRSKDGITLLEEPGTAFYYVVLNTSNEKLADENVRKAINMVINKQNLIDGANDGFGTATNTFIAEGLPGYRADFNPHPYDVEAAKELMANSAYPDGFEISLTVPESRSTHGQLLKADLAQIGIDLTIDIVESGTLWDTVENMDHEMTIIGWSYVVMDPDVGYYSLYKKDDLSGNYTAWGNEETDALLLKGRTSTDAEERDQIYAELEEKFQGAAPYVPLYWGTEFCAHHADLQGVTIPPCSLYYVYGYSWQ